METLKTFSRIGLSLIIIACGGYLLYNKSAAKFLPEHLENLSQIFIPAKYLIPYSLIYYNLFALFFTVSGLFSLAQSTMAPYFYMFAAVMFCATYDNPMIAKNQSDMYLRSIFVGCHIAIFTCLMMFAEEKEKELIKAEKMKAQQNKKSQ